MHSGYTALNTCSDDPQAGPPAGGEEKRKPELWLIG
jgi:hypothetical protein